MYTGGGSKRGVHVFTPGSLLPPHAHDPLHIYNDAQESFGKESIWKTVWNLSDNQEIFETFCQNHELDPMGVCP